MHKLDKYIRRYTQDFVESNRSRYYKFAGQILRVSDHIGSNSSGSLSIIILDDDYVLHNHTTGNIAIMTYKETLGFIKSLSLCSSIMAPSLASTNWNISKGESIIRDSISLNDFTINSKRVPKLWNLLSEGQRGDVLKQLHISRTTLTNEECNLIANNNSFKNSIKYLIFL